MRRIGSNIRKQSADAKSNRPIRNIIRYTDDEKPRNDYPKRIISPTSPGKCCSDETRVNVGTIREVDGFKFCYRVCEKCGYALRFFYPAVESTSEAVKDYRRWKRYMTQ